MVKSKSYITNLLSFVIIVFLLSICGLIFGEYFNYSDYYINNQSDYNLHVEVLSKIKIDTTYFAHKSTVKLGDSRGALPSIAFDLIRFYLSTNDSSNNKLVYELYPVTERDCLDWKSGESSKAVTKCVQAQLKFPDSVARRWNDDFIRRVAAPEQVDWQALL